VSIEDGMRIEEELGAQAEYAGRSALRALR
jgi:hypothetical protein